MRWRRALSGRALDLAVFRVAVCAVLLSSAEVHGAVAYAPAPLLGELARAALCLGAFAGLIGRGARLGMLIAAVSGLYLLGLPHAAGVGLHNHHLVWFAALLALSPCADALVLRRGPGPRAAGAGEARLAYGVPLRAVWLILGAIYFWPGFWKLATSGAAWMTAENLQNHLYWKWAQSWDFTPALRLDQLPGVLTAGAIGVVLFELSVPALLLTRRGRWVALGAALGFHAFTWALFDIRFESLWMCLVALVPWHRWQRSAEPPAEPPAEPSAERSATAERWPPATPLLAALVLAVWLAGARGETRGWPLACYPTFDRGAPPTMPTLLVEVDGVSVRLEDYASPSPALWAEVWQLIGLGRPVSGPALERFWDRHRPGDGRELRFYRAEMRVEPGRRDERPRTVRLLHTARR